MKGIGQAAKAHKEEAQMRAEEVMRIIRDMPKLEREKVLYGLMKDFNQEMAANPEFKSHAIDAMQRFMQKREDSGEDTSAFRAILK